MDFLCECVKTISVKAVIKKDGKVLFVQNADKHWDLPGGRMRCGEDLGQTLQRESQEEIGTGVSYEERPLFAFFWHYPEHQKHGLVIGYECKAENENFVCGDDVVDAQFLSPEEIMEKHISKNLAPHYQRMFGKV